MPEPLAPVDLHTCLAELTDRSLSRSARYGHLALTVVATCMTAMLATVLLTETWLPARTVVSMWVLFGIGCAWTLFGLRVLSRKRPLLANREVIAGGMALGFSAIFTIGAAIVGVASGGRGVTGVSTLGATMTLVALAVLVRALMRRAELRALRDRLERELSAG